MIQRGRIRSILLRSPLGAPLRFAREKVLPAKRPTTVSFAVNENQDSRNSRYRTFVVVGTPRGGTTMIAGLLRGMGIFMGPNVGVTLEDDAFHALPRELAAVIAARNAEHDIWGWKHPGATNYLPRLYPHLRNPRLICVARDIVASGIGVDRRAGLGQATAMQNSLDNLTRNVSVSNDLGCPTLFISYELSVRAPDIAIAEVSRFLCVEPPRDIRKLKAFMIPGRYKFLAPGGPISIVQGGDAARR